MTLPLAASPEWGHVHLSVMVRNDARNGTLGGDREILALGRERIVIPAR